MQLAPAGNDIGTGEIDMRDGSRLVLVVLAWTGAAAIVGWVMFNYVFVEHGSVVLWVAGIGLGFILGLVHVLILIERRRKMPTGKSKRSPI